MQTNELRKTVKKLMVDLEYDSMGNRKQLARDISIPDDQVNVNTVNMAITGYRNGKRSREVLVKLYFLLRKQIKDPRFRNRLSGTAGVG